MAHVKGQDADAVYAAVNRWTDRSLRADLGVLTDQTVWSREVLAALHRRVVAHYSREGPFDGWWRELLDGANDMVLQLAAELLWLYLLFPANVSLERKQELVEATLSWQAEPPELSGEPLAALRSGLAPTGATYGVRRKAQVRFLLEAVADLKSRASQDREQLLADPWRCKAWIGQLPDDSAPVARAVLLHLLHPRTFEPIVSQQYKRDIVAAFGDRVPVLSEDLDEAVLQVRGALEAELGLGFAFTREDVLGRWR